MILLGKKAWKGQQQQLLLTPRSLRSNFDTSFLWGNQGLFHFPPLNRTRKLSSCESPDSIFRLRFLRLSPHILDSVVNTRVIDKRVCNLPIIHIRCKLTAFQHLTWKLNRNEHAARPANLKGEKNERREKEEKRNQLPRQWVCQHEPGLICSFKLKLWKNNTSVCSIREINVTQMDERTTGPISMCKKNESGFHSIGTSLGLKSVGMCFPGPKSFDTKWSPNSHNLAIPFLIPHAHVIRTLSGRMHEYEL